MSDHESDWEDQTDDDPADPTYQPNVSFFQNSILDPVRRLLRSANNRQRASIEEISSESSTDAENSSDDEMSLMKNLSGHVPLLTSDNYHDWLSAITSFMRVNERFIDPATPFAELDATKQAKATAAWDIINLYCDSTNKGLIADTTNSTDALAVLKRRYADTSLVNKMGLYFAAFHTLLGSDESMSAYVSRKRTAIAQLAAMNEKLSDAAQVTTLLHGLPKSYDSVVTSVMSWDEKTLSFAKVSQLLLNEETRAKSSSAPDTAAKASDDVPRCSYRLCQKRGHTESSCRLKQSHERRNKSKPRPKAKAHQAVSDDERNSSSIESPTEDEHEEASFCFFANKPAPTGSAALRKRQKESFVVPRVQPMCKPRSNRDRSRHSVGGSADNNKQTKNILGFPRNADLRELIEASKSKKEFTPTHEAQKPSSQAYQPLSRAPQEFSQADLDENFLELHVNNDDVIFDDVSNKAMKSYAALSCSQTTNDKSFRNCWIIDSGASTHMCNDKSRFNTLDFCTSGTVRIANGDLIPIKGYGNIEMQIADKSLTHKIVLKNVAFIPKLDMNLLSVRKVTATDHEVSFVGNSCFLLKNGRKILLGSLKGNCYRLNEVPSHEAHECIHQLHRRLAHRNLRAIKSQPDLKIKKCQCNPDCESCIRGKLPHTPYPKVAKKTENVLDVIVSDICGPISVESYGKSRYFATFIDAKSNFTVVKMLRVKSDYKRAAIEFVENLKTHLKTKPIAMRFERAGENLDTELQTYLRGEGIKTELTCHHSSPQNGIAERANRTLCDAVRAMMIESKLPQFLWSEALQNAVYTFNRIVRKGKTKTPYEEFFGRKPTATFVEFGADVFVGTTIEGRKKLDARAEKMKMLRVDDQSKGFRVWDGHRVRVERNIKFLHVPTAQNNQDPISTKTPESSNSPSTDKGVTELRRSARIKNKSPEAANVLIVPTGVEPKTYKQAVNGEEKSAWLASMEKELSMIEKKGTWSLVDLPPGRKAIGSKWVYKIKRHITPWLYKSRLVALGFTQKYGVDYDEVFAPVARSQTFRTLLAVASHGKMIIKQYDVESAFLNGDLDEEIYLKPPPGHDVGSKVYKLHKSLYGLKQSARVWYKALDAKFAEIGFTQSKVDPCLHIYSKNGRKCYSIQHVDDILFAATDEAIIDDSVRKLSESFELKDLGKLKHFLGIDVTTTLEGAFQLSQSSYIDNIATDLNLTDAKSAVFPLDPGYFKLADDKFLSDNSEYRKIIGKLLYAFINTRPDISASVNILAQRVESPRELDLLETKRVVKYLLGTKHIRLNFSGGEEEVFSFRAYSDANFAENIEDRKSNSGILCMMNGAPISWSSRKQGVVATSTTEAEFYAIAEAAKEMMWLHQLLKELNVIIELPIIISSDNQSAIKMLENEKFSQRTKHIDVQYHFLRDLIQNKTVKLSFVPTEINAADLLTKPLAGAKIKSLRKLSGFVE